MKIPKNVRFVFDRGSQPVTVFSDPKRVVQVISNFLTNAIKFTSEGEIKLASKDIEREISSLSRIREWESRRKIVELYSIALLS